MKGTLEVYIRMPYLGSPLYTQQIEDIGSDYSSAVYSVRVTIDEDKSQTQAAAPAEKRERSKNEIIVRNQKEMNANEQREKQLGQERREEEHREREQRQQEQTNQGQSTQKYQNEGQDQRADVLQKPRRKRVKPTGFD